ncbi:MAG: hypothetical protein JWQ48_3663 [Conexibacter sp.]|nr:hypothetical protein [Conexibacter sp.]
MAAREVAAPFARPRLTRWDALGVPALLVLTVIVYLPFARHGGWYYDDWAIYAEMQDAPHGTLAAHFHACSASMPAGRSLACVYHAVEFTLFGGHRMLYHLGAMGFLLLMAVLGYRVLAWCRLPRPWALLVGGLLIAYPASDATRLWPVGAVAQYVLVLQLSGVLLGLHALREGIDRRAAIALHAASAALSVFAMLTYEIAVPLVALNGLVYLAAYRSRRVLWRAILDGALAVLFVVYRASIDPPSKDSGFVVHRDLHGDLERVRVLLRGAWRTWSFVFASGGGLAAVGIAVLLAAGVTAAALDADLRRRLLPWMGLALASALVAAVSIIAFTTANDLYVPDATSTFNRLNAPGALASCALFVALLGIAFELLRRFVPVRIVTVLVTLAALAVGWHQLGISSDHKRSWEASWRLQSQALAGYRVALRGVPPTADLVGFDTPVWERGYVPVFSASWDLRGALDFTTDQDPNAAMPAATGMTCAPAAAEVGGLTLPYRGGAPLYFVSPSRRAAVRIASQQACTTQLQRWPVPALFA